MKKLLIYSLAAAILFTVSATVSLWLQNTKRAEGDDRPKPALRTNDFKKDEDDRTPPIRTAKDREALVEREKQLARLQQSGKVVLDDVRSERAALDELRKQVAGELKVLNDRLSEVEAARVKLTSDQAKSVADIERLKNDTRALMPPPPLAPVRPVSPPPLPVSTRPVPDYDKMDPARTAETLRQMVEKKDFGGAVAILAQMKKSKANAVLLEVQLKDPQLAVKFEDQLNGGQRDSIPRPQ